MQGNHIRVLAIALSIAVHFAVPFLVLRVAQTSQIRQRSGQEGTVELLMIEYKGTDVGKLTGPNVVASMSSSDPHNIPEQPMGSVPEPAAARPKSAPQISDNGEITASAPARSAISGVENQRSLSGRSDATAQSNPDLAREAPVFHLQGTDSEANAFVFGDRVVPASRDDRFRNKPPAYPLEAELHGEHGTVEVVIHVLATGVAASAELRQSSGYRALDQAALLAVRKWHFRPAMSRGQPVPFDMPFRFIFDPT